MTLTDAYETSIKITYSLNNLLTPPTWSGDGSLVCNRTRITVKPSSTRVTGQVHLPPCTESWCKPCHSYSSPLASHVYKILPSFCEVSKYLPYLYSCYTWGHDCTAYTDVGLISAMTTFGAKRCLKLRKKLSLLIWKCHLTCRDCTLVLLHKFNLKCFTLFAVF